MWDVIGNFVDIGTAVILIMQIKEALSKPGRVKKLIAILLVVSLCLTPVFSYLGESIDLGIGIKFFVAIAIGISIGIFRLNSYLSGDSSFTIETKVRIVGDADKTWKDSVEAQIGDKVEFQLQYKNKSSETHQGVVIRNVLPQSLQYVAGSTKVYNVLHPNGFNVTSDDIIGNGITIGNYSGYKDAAADDGANAFIRITAEVKGDTLACGRNVLVGWGQAQADAADNQTVLQDYATVIVNKICENEQDEPAPPVEPEA